MLMNSNELLLKINHVLQESGIINDLTDFFREHSEYFTDTYDRDIICSCDIGIAMCCKPEERQNAGVFITIDIGAHGAVQVYLSDHSRSTGTAVSLKRSINGKEVSRYVLN